MESADSQVYLSSTQELIPLKVSIYPNPARHYVNVAVDNVSKYSVSILNLEGKLMTRLINSDTIDVTTIPDGMYILEFVDLTTGQKALDRILIAN